MSFDLQSVAFDGDTLDLIAHNDQPYVACKPVTVALGLAWQPQQQRLDAMRGRWGITEIVIPTAGGKQQALTIPLRKLPAWLYSIKPGKVAPHVRPKLERYQAECDEILWQHWSRRFQPEPTGNALESRMDNVEANLGKVAGSLAVMAEHMAQLVGTSGEQARKLEVTARYIALLEMNQRGKVRVTPEIEEETIALHAQGMPQADIARLLRISAPTVNQLVKGTYSRNAELSKRPRPTVEQALERMADRERAMLLELGELPGGVQ